MFFHYIYFENKGLISLTIRKAKFVIFRRYQQHSEDLIVSNIHRVNVTIVLDF